MTEYRKNLFPCRSEKYSRTIKVLRDQTNKKLKILDEEIKKIIVGYKVDIAKEIELKKKILVLSKVVKYYSGVMRKFIKASQSDRTILGSDVADASEKFRKTRSADSGLETHPVQRIFYDLETLKEDLSRWQKWIELDSKEWNGERKKAYRSALHLMISALYQYKHLTYEIMFDRDLLAALAIESPFPENDFVVSSSKMINLVKVQSRILVRIQDSKYKIVPYEYKVGGFTSSGNELTKTSINNFTKMLDMSPEQEDAVVEFFNKNANRSLFQWTPWNQWSACSVTCGVNGLKTRRRVCVVLNIPPKTWTCSGGDMQKISCSGSKTCRDNTEALCWIDSYGFLKEQVDCECSFVPHLCRNGGVCEKKYLTNGSKDSFPHYSLGCQCPIWYSGLICDHAWYTSWNVQFVFGICGSVLSISSIILWCCLRTDKNSAQNNSSKKSDNSHSRNITNSSLPTIRYQDLPLESYKKHATELESDSDVSILEFITSPNQSSDRKSNFETGSTKLDANAKLSHSNVMMQPLENMNHSSDTEDSTEDVSDDDATKNFFKERTLSKKSKDSVQRDKNASAAVTKYRHDKISSAQKTDATFFPDDESVRVEKIAAKENSDRNVLMKHPKARICYESPHSGRSVESCADVSFTHINGCKPKPNVNVRKPKHRAKNKIFGSPTQDPKAFYCSPRCWCNKSHFCQLSGLTRSPSHQNIFFSHKLSCGKQLKERIGYNKIHTSFKKANSKNKNKNSLIDSGSRRFLVASYPTKIISDTLEGRKTEDALISYRSNCQKIRRRLAFGQMKQ